MARLKLTLEYAGTRYSGWQRVFYEGESREQPLRAAAVVPARS